MKYFCALNSLAIVLLLGCGKSEPEQMTKGPQPLSSVKSESLSWEVAWEKAGFEMGWGGPSKEFGSLAFTEDLDELEKSESLVVFLAPGAMRVGIFDRLPAPLSEFGLAFFEYKVEDEEL